MANAVIPPDIADLLLLIIALSMLLTPGLFIFYDKVIAPRNSRQQEQAADEITAPANIIIAGHGRFGGIMSRALQAAEYDITVVDYSNEQLKLLRRFGLSAYFGDATRPDLLHAAGIEEAKILVIAIDGKDSITELARHVREHHPHVHIVVRAVDRWHVYDLWAVGCRDIIRETYDSSIRATRSAFEALGHPREQAERLTHAFEEFDRKTMVEMADLYSIDDPHAENSLFTKHVRENQDTWTTQLKAKMKAALATKTGT